LLRQRLGELAGDVVLVVSNHPDMRPAAEYFGLPFEVIAVTPETRGQAEAAQQALLEKYEIHLIVLARYMQILSSEFTARWAGRVINIHHSFLPAFAGARPYHQAHARGVKLIGATAHYATADLDEGPIIEQDVVRVSHRDEISEMVRKGRDLERQVLARAVRLHLDRRLLIEGHRTIVFT
jgi:formyltetrahydrofolate deformylase